jgi:hypothetical protein
MTKENELLDEVHSQTISGSGKWEIQCYAITWLSSLPLANEPDSSVLTKKRRSLRQMVRDVMR